MSHYELHWREPLWLVALLVLLLFTFVQQRIKHRQPSRLTHFADLHLLPYLISKPHKLFDFTRWLTYTAFCLLIIAISGPFLVTAEQESAQHKAIDIALIVDISPSMNATDITPSRLARAKIEITDLLELRPRDRMALITFSANAYVTLPLTYDKAAVHQFAQALTTDLAQRKGSNLSRAIELAQETLHSSQANSRAIILLSDGEHHSSSIQQQAQRLAQQGIPLFILGMGTTSGAPVIDNARNTLSYQGVPVISKLDTETLQLLATTTQGLFITPSANNNDWAQVNTRLDQLSMLNAYELYTQSAIKLTPWLLLFALTLIILPGLSRSHIMIWTLCVILPTAGLSPSATASAWEEAQALEALKNQEIDKAKKYYRHIEGFNGDLGRGSVAYKKQLWQQASDHFNKAKQSADTDQERAKASYNLGNALTQLGLANKAVAAYQQALHFQPNYPRASFNLNLVNQILLSPPSQDNKQTDVNRRESATNQTISEEVDDSGNRVSDAITNSIVKQVQLAKKSFQPSEQLGAYIPDKLDKLLKKRYSRRDQMDGLTKAGTKPW